MNDDTLNKMEDRMEFPNLHDPLTFKEKVLIRMMMPCIEMLIWIVIQLSPHKDDERFLADWKSAREEIEKELGL